MSDVARDMQLVVAYLYNTNGMATWCLECAAALHNKGYKVVLVVSSKVALPENYVVPVFVFDEQQPQAKSIAGKIKNRLQQYWQLLPGTLLQHHFLEQLDKVLQSNNIKADAYLLNQSNLYSKHIAIPQFVAAWAYKPFLKSHLQKVKQFSTGIVSFIAATKNAFYWHKADWFAYENATGVLSVSDKLTKDIRSVGIDNVFTVYPGTDLKDITATTTHNTALQLVMMALDVEEPRKKIKWAIEALKSLPYNAFHLTLIGSYSEAFKHWATQNNFPVTFTGKLPRQQALQQMKQHDVLLFASSLDDWGYVQVEAMGNNVAVLSPNKSPFDEIIGREDYLYEEDNAADLRNKIQALIDKKEMADDKKWFYHRYQHYFSGNAFANRIITTLNDCLT